MFAISHFDWWQMFLGLRGTCDRACNKRSRFSHYCRHLSDNEGEAEKRFNSQESYSNVKTSRDLSRKYLCLKARGMDPLYF